MLKKYLRITEYVIILHITLYMYMHLSGKIMKISILLNTRIICVVLLSFRFNFLDTYTVYTLKCSVRLISPPKNTLNHQYRLCK